jgi:hypothetical protein
VVVVVILSKDGRVGRVLDLWFVSEAGVQGRVDLDFLLLLLHPVLRCDDWSVVRVVVRLLLVRVEDSWHGVFVCVVLRWDFIESLVVRWGFLVVRESG